MAIRLAEQLVVVRYLHDKSGKLKTGKQSKDFPDGQRETQILGRLMHKSIDRKQTGSKQFWADSAEHRLQRWKDQQVGLIDAEGQVQLNTNTGNLQANRSGR